MDQQQVEVPVHEANHPILVASLIRFGDQNIPQAADDFGRWC